MNDHHFHLILTSAAAFIVVFVFTSLMTGGSFVNYGKISRYVTQAKVDLSDYEKGACAVDSDCVPTGCSETVCGNYTMQIDDMCMEGQESLDLSSYSCACDSGMCAWK